MLRTLSQRLTVGLGLLARGSLLPQLKIDSPKVRLVGDADGLAALKTVVGTIIHGL